MSQYTEKVKHYFREWFAAKGYRMEEDLQNDSVLFVKDAQRIYFSFDRGSMDCTLHLSGQYVPLYQYYLSKTKQSQIKLPEGNTWDPDILLPWYKLMLAEVLE